MITTNTINIDPLTSHAREPSHPGHSISRDQGGSSDANLGPSFHRSGDMPVDLNSPEISQALTELNESLRKTNHQLTISVDPVSGKAVFKVIDTATGSVMLQVPSANSADIEAPLILRRGVLLDTQ